MRHAGSPHRWFLLLVALLVSLLVVVGLLTPSGTPPASDVGAKAIPPVFLLPVVPRTCRSPSGVWSPSDTGPYRALVSAMRTYLDPEENAWTGRKAVQRELTKFAAAGQYPLTHPKLLTWLVAQGRSFLAPLHDKAWAQKHGFQIHDRGGWGFELKGGEEDQQPWAHIRAPNSYIDRPIRLHDVPRPGPWPVVFALHRLVDLDGDQGAGPMWLASHWDPAIHAGLYDDWFVLMPIVEGAAFVEDGQIRPARVFSILRDFWNRYHMDFDRMVIDGGEEALLFACTNGALFLSGLVLRDAEVEDGKLAWGKLAASIGNIRQLPIYVVDRPDLARALEAAGLERVIAGDGKASMVQWMNERRRTMPKKFAWTVSDRDQRLAYWVNLDALWDGPKRVVEVEISDKEPNTITIQAIGVEELSLFLDDDLVDLDQSIKVRINGILVHDQKLEPREKYAEIKRDLKEIFEKPVVDVRKFRYYGWLKPASIVRMSVPPPRQDVDEGKLMARAQKAFDRGSERLARALLDKLIRLPPHAHTQRAKDLRKLLK